MQKNLIILNACIIFLFIVGCTNSDSEKKDYTLSDANIVNKNSGEIENEARLKDFIKNTEAGQKDRIRVVGYTKEGDPILTDLTYNENQLEVTTDSTRDKYGNGGIKSFKCEKVKAEGNKYFIIGCEGYETPYYLAEKF